MRFLLSSAVKVLTVSSIGFVSMRSITTHSHQQSVVEALNATAGPMGFRCVPVSWEDAQRGTVGGGLSCWGGNISDVRLWEKKGTLLYTLRSENWNERL